MPAFPRQPQQGYITQLPQGLDTLDLIRVLAHNATLVTMPEEVDYGPKANVPPVDLYIETFLKIYRAIQQ